MADAITGVEKWAALIAPRITEKKWVALIAPRNTEERRVSTQAQNTHTASVLLNQSVEAYTLLNAVATSLARWP